MSSAHRGWWPLLAAVLVALAALVIAASPRQAQESDAARVERVADQLRCPTCQGLSVADSPASTARAIRDDIARRVSAGESDGEIKAAYVDRYGEWILLRPKGSGAATAVWAVPVAGLVLATGGLVLAFRRWRREPRLAATEADRELVEHELVERGAPGR